MGYCDKTTNVVLSSLASTKWVLDELKPFRPIRNRIYYENTSRNLNELAPIVGKRPSTFNTEEITTIHTAFKALNYYISIAHHPRFGYAT